MKSKVFLIALILPIALHAQDIIVMRDGSTIISKVLEINKTDIKYKKFNNLNGPTYTIEKAENFTSTNSVGVKLYMKQLYGLKERMAVWSGSKDKSDLLKAIKEDIPDYDDFTIVGI